MRHFLALGFDFGWTCFLFLVFFSFFTYERRYACAIEGNSNVIAKPEISWKQKQKTNGRERIRVSTYHHLLPRPRPLAAAEPKATIISTSSTTLNRPIIIFILRQTVDDEESGRVCESDLLVGFFIFAIVGWPLRWRRTTLARKHGKHKKKLGRHSKATVSFRRNARRCQRTDEAVRRLVADWSIRAIRRLPSMEGRPFAAAAPPGRSTRPRPPEEKSPPERRRRRGKKNETKKKNTPQPLSNSLSTPAPLSPRSTLDSPRKKKKNSQFRPMPHPSFNTTALERLRCVFPGSAPLYSAFPLEGTIQFGVVVMQS